MFRVQRALSPETGVYNRIIMYISYSALISITIEQTTKSMKSFLLVQYQGDNQISMHASHTDPYDDEQSKTSNNFGGKNILRYM